MTDLRTRIPLDGGETLYTAAKNILSRHQVTKGFHPPLSQPALPVTFNGVEYGVRVRPHRPLNGADKDQVSIRYEPSSNRDAEFPVGHAVFINGKGEMVRDGRFGPSSAPEGPFVTFSYPLLKTPDERTAEKAVPATEEMVKRTEDLAQQLHVLA